MDNIDILFELPLAIHIAAIWFVLCATVLFVMLLAAPRRNCFFFRWRPETRLLALVFGPTLLIIWPVVLYWWLIKASGINPDDLDCLDD